MPACVLRHCFLQFADILKHFDAAFAFIDEARAAGGAAGQLLYFTAWDQLNASPGALHLWHISVQ